MAPRGVRGAARRAWLVVRGSSWRARCGVACVERRGVYGVVQDGVLHWNNARLCALRVELRTQLCHTLAQLHSSRGLDL